MRLFNRDRRTWNLNQISQSISMNKTSAFRYVNTLVQLGYLKKHPQTKLISLGPQVVNLALAFAQTENLSEISRPFIDEVSEKYNLTVEIALFEEDIIVVVYRRETRDLLFPRFPITRTTERFYCTSLGKAILAYLPQNEKMNIIKNLLFLPKTPNTIMRKVDLLADLEKTKERGYAVNNEEWVMGLIALGSPILDLHTNKVLGAVCFDFSTAQYSIKVVENKYGKVLLKLATDISQTMTIQR